TFGLPCPTTLFTVGLLAFLARPYPAYVLAVPLLWSAVGTSAAFGLGMYEDLGLIAAGLIAAGLLAVRLSFGAGRVRRPRGLTAAGGLTAAEPAAPTRRSPQATRPR